jgi:hypothetical protein
VQGISGSANLTDPTGMISCAEEVAFTALSLLGLAFSVASFAEPVTTISQVSTEALLSTIGATGASYAALVRCMR